MIDARSFIIGRVVESLTLENIRYGQLRYLIDKMCECLKCETLTDDEWKFISDYCKQMDEQIIDMQLGRHRL